MNDRSLRKLYPCLAMCHKLKPYFVSVNLNVLILILYRGHSDVIEIEFSLGIVMRRGVLHPVGVHSLQKKFGGLGPWCLEVTGVGVTITSLFTCSASGVRFNVLAQVVTSHEPLVAYGAGKPFFARVGTEVPLKFIRSGKSLTTK